MLFLLLFFLAVLIAAEVYSIYKGMDKITYDAQVSQSLLEPNEEFTITTKIGHYKFWFLPYLEMVENFPDQLQFPHDEDIVVDRMHSNLSPELCLTRLHSTFYLMPNQAFYRSVDVSLPKRGRYLLQDATLYGGDFLGIRDNCNKFKVHKEIIVMPERISYPNLDHLLGDFLGNISVRRFLFDDPMLTVGFSEYTGREPMRDISWTQSARMGKMMVKEYDHTIDYCVEVLVNVQSVPNSFESEDEGVETCFSLARGVCEVLESKQMKYGFSTNAITLGPIGSLYSVDQGIGNRHFFRVMEILGRALPQSAEYFNATLSRACRSIQTGKHFIIITPKVDPSWEESLHRLQESTVAQVIVLTPDSFQTSDSEQKEEAV